MEVLAQSPRLMDVYNFRGTGGGGRARTGLETLFANFQDSLKSEASHSHQKQQQSQPELEGTTSSSSFHKMTVESPPRETTTNNSRLVHQVAHQPQHPSPPVMVVPWVSENEHGLLVPPPNKPGEPFVNVFMVIDPNTMTCLVPKQVISYKQMNSNVVSTTVFGPQLLHHSQAFPNGFSYDNSTNNKNTPKAASLEHEQQGSLKQEVPPAKTQTFNSNNNDNNGESLVASISKNNDTSAPQASLRSVMAPNMILSYNKDEEDRDFSESPAMMMWDDSFALASATVDNLNREFEDEDDEQGKEEGPQRTFDGCKKPLFHQQQQDNDEVLDETELVAPAPPAVPGTVTSASNINSDVALPPLRFLSAYNFFFRDKKERILNGVAADWSEDKKRKLLEEHWSQDRNKKRRHRRSHGKIDFTTLSKLISARWKELPEHRKDFYRQIASKDFERFKREAREQEAAQAASVISLPSSASGPPVMDALLMHASVVG